MPLLLDTCTLLWLSMDLDQLSPKACEAILTHTNDLFVSCISALEMSTKCAKKKLDLPGGAEEWFRAVLKHHGVAQVPINFQIASYSGNLPPLHKDPFDRLIIATAWEYHMTIVTPDRYIRQYPNVECLW